MGFDGMEPPKVRRGPPRWLDGIVAALTPPLSRESILGDLAERYRSPRWYALDALAVLPFVIVSQGRRATYLPMFGLQAFALFACLGGFDAQTSVPPMWARAAIPTSLALVTLLLRDAYRSSDEHPVRIPILWVLRFGQGVDQRSKFAVPGGQLSAGELAEDYARFRRRVMVRNIAEIVALLMIVIGSSNFLLRVRPPVAPIGWVFVAVFILLASYLAIRGYAPRLLQKVSFASLQSFYQQELARQHRMRRFLWWWWFVPLFTGLITNFVVRGLVGKNFVLITLGSELVLLLGFCIAALVHRRGRDVEAKIGRLNDLNERQAS